MNNEVNEDLIKEVVDDINIEITDKIDSDNFHIHNELEKHGLLFFAGVSIFSIADDRYNHLNTTKKIDKHLRDEIKKLRLEILKLKCL